MAPKKTTDDPVEKLTGMIEAILDKRDQRAKEEKDPKARFDRIMDRLESYLDGQESGDNKKEAKPKPESKSGGIVSALFGEEEAS